MILKQGEKVHVIHRRKLEKEPRRHFIGTVEGYDQGVARITGHLYTLERNSLSYVKRPEKRTRLVSIVSGDVLVNVLPDDVNLDAITYQQKGKTVRVTDGNWHLDLSETNFI